MLTKLYQTIRCVAINIWRSDSGVNCTVTGFGSQNHRQREWTVRFRMADISPSESCCHPTAFSLAANFPFLRRAHVILSPPAFCGCSYIALPCLVVSASSVGVCT